MNTKRPCECGCSFENHAPIGSPNDGYDYVSTTLYCKECAQHPETWCYNFRPIGNLEYLEWLSR
jgi:hypothetical protein